MISDYYFYICILHTGRCKTRANQNADTRLYERPVNYSMPVLREGSA